MGKNMYTTNTNGEAAVRVSTNVKGDKTSIYGVDENGNAAMRVVGGIGGSSSGGGSTTPAVTDAKKINATISSKNSNGETVSYTASVEEHLQTLKNDDAEKGDAIQAIQQLIPGSATPENPLVTRADLPTGNGSEDFGLRGDYCSMYGVTASPNGRPKIGTVGTNSIIVPAGLRIEMPNDGQTTIASQSIVDIPLNKTCYFVFVPDLDEPYQFCEQICFKKTKPSESDATCRVWFDGDSWWFRSINVGDTWIKVIRAQPLGKCIFTNGSLTRINYIGWYHDAYKDTTESE